MNLTRPSNALVFSTVIVSVMALLGLCIVCIQRGVPIHLVLPLLIFSLTAGVFCSIYAFSSFPKHDSWSRLGRGVVHSLCLSLYFWAITNVLIAILQHEYLITAVFALLALLADKTLPSALRRRKADRNNLVDSHIATALSEWSTRVQEHIDHPPADGESVFDTLKKLGPICETTKKLHNRDQWQLHASSVDILGVIEERYFEALENTLKRLREQDRAVALRNFYTQKYTQALLLLGIQA